MNTAREALEVFGNEGQNWGKEYYNHNHRRCSIGAIVKTRQISVDNVSALADDPEVRHLAEVIADEYPEHKVEWYGKFDPMDTIYTFNDADSTKFDDIRRVFEKTAVWIDEQV